MPVDTAANLVDVLRSCQVLTPAQLDEVAKTLAQQFPNARSLARALIDREWLTAYQVNLLMQGAADKLSHGPYIIIERLGDNALGQVFKARHQLMNRLVALTIVREELLAQPKAVEQFYQEIQAASQLSDAHILHSYDAGPIGKTHFFAMEYVEGVDLETLVQQSGPLQVSTASGFIHQAAEGLYHAHERGLLHHDLRPANLLVAKNAVPMSFASRTPLPSKTQLKVATLKISNMGLTMLQPRLRRATVGVPTSEGTLDYVAPEQSQGNAPPDIRANLYSLGCIYYFLLAGRPPFSGGGSSTTLRQHQLDEPPPLESFRKDVPAETCKLIHTLLAKQPEERYQTPAELLSALGPGTTRKLPVSACSTRVGLSKPALADARQRLPKKYVLGGLAAGVPLLLAFVALSAWLLRPSGTQAEKSLGSKGQASSPALATYVPKATYEETILATLRASGYPSLEGKWHYIGPFDNPDKKGFDTAYPPEQSIDFQRSYTSKGNKLVSWKDLPNFRLGHVYDIKQVLNHEWAVAYFHHEIEVREPVALELSLGSDDTLTVWLNGQQLLANNVYRDAEPDQDSVTLYLKPGKNQLLLKVCQGTGGWAFYVMPRWPGALKNAFGGSLQRDFPKRKS
jgi:serine/threonine protein kinase